MDFSINNYEWRGRSIGRQLHNAINVELIQWNRIVAPNHTIFYTHNFPQFQNKSNI